MSAAADITKQIDYLTRALKAPRIREAATRLADQARDAGWSHEEYLAAVLDREVSARDASGAQLRIRAAGFGTAKTIEDFVFDHQPALKRDLIGAPGHRHVPGHRQQRGPARTTRHRQDPPRGRARDQGRPGRPPGPVRHRHRVGHPTPGRPQHPAGSPRSSPGCDVTDC